MANSRIILVVGPRFSGKSRFVENLLPKIRESGLRLAGFLQRGVFDETGVKIGYDLVSVEDDSAVTLARRSALEGPWEFRDEAFEKAAGLVREDADVIILDEIGPLEISGGGHAETMHQALSTGAAVLIVVREELEEHFFKHMPDTRDVHVVHFSPEAEESLSGQILSLLMA
jgi:nucleoside-triphosphatase THEP1